MALLLVPSICCVQQLPIDRTQLVIAFVTLIPVDTVIATLIPPVTMRKIARSMMIAKAA